MGVVVKTSENPFPGVPEKPSLQPQQPGEVLIRYELEAVRDMDHRGFYTPRRLHAMLLKACHHAAVQHTYVAASLHAAG